MISPTVQEALNKQIKAELDSAYLYLAMACAADAQGFRGAAHWLRLQWEEETEHAMKLLDHIQDRGGKVTLHGIEQPAFEFKTLGDLFEKVLAHERKVTGLIHKLCELAAAEKDWALQVLLQWFVTEQVEEEKNATEIVDSLRLVADKEMGLLHLDRHLAERGD